MKLLLRRKYIPIIAIVIIVFLILLSFNYIIFNKKVKYPMYKPFDKFGYNEADFPVNFTQAEELAYMYLEKYVHISKDMIEIKNTHGSYTAIAVKDGNIIMNIYTVTKNDRFGSIYIQASTGRLSVLLISNYDFLKSCENLGRISNETAVKYVIDIMKDLGYINETSIKDIGVVIDRIYRWRCCTDIDFNITIYGHKVIYQNNGYAGGVLSICRRNNEIIYPEIIIPSTIIRIYELGLFIKIDKPPIDKNNAFAGALEKIKSYGIVSKYTYEYKGMYWLILKNKSLQYMAYDPVPHLVYWFRFKVDYKGGSGVLYDVMVDAVTGEILSIYRTSINR